MHLKFLLKAVCLLLLLPSTRGYSGNVCAPDNEEPIVIIPAEQGSKHRPHSKAFLPFEANYNAGLASVLVRFIKDVGEVEISIRNLSSGEYNDYTINSKIGSIVLPISGDFGDYVITFTLQNGKQFIGEFSINDNY